MPQLNALPEPLDIDLAATALIVVDMQNAFARPGGMLEQAGIDISGADAAVTNCAALVEAARAATVPVIYLQVGYSPDLSDAGGDDSPNPRKELALVTMRRRPELAGTLLIEGTWDYAIIDELTPQPGDLVIAKRRYDGFTGTDLHAQLQARGVRNVVLCGITTNVCVESTGRSAFFHEYWPILVDDATNHAGPDFVRQATRWNFENIFGWVATTDDVVSVLEGA